MNPVRLRLLDLTQPMSAGRRPFISAASGLAMTRSHIYVVADDELHLGVFPREGSAPGRGFRILQGELPLDKRDRKRRKPDLEALALLPLPNGNSELLAIPSGSTPSRTRAALVRLDASGEPTGIHQVELAELYISAARQFPELNIEGAAVHDDRLILFQRGNGRAGQNGLLHLDLNRFRSEAASGRVTGNCLVQSEAVKLPEDKGPLSFTDGFALPGGRLLFTAVAENSASTYEDGAVSGSAIGILDGHAVTALHWLSPPLKVEGLWAESEGPGTRLWLVTDDDDPVKPSALWTCLWSDLPALNVPVATDGKAQAAFRDTTTLPSARTAAWRPLANAASAIIASVPAQSPATNRLSIPGTAGPGLPVTPPSSDVTSRWVTTSFGR